MLSKEWHGTSDIFRARLRLCPNYELKPDGIGFILNLIPKPNSTTGSAYSELTTDSIFKHRLGRHQQYNAPKSYRRTFDPQKCCLGRQHTDFRQKCKLSPHDIPNLYDQTSVKSQSLFTFISSLFAYTMKVNSD